MVYTSWIGSSTPPVASKSLKTKLFLVEGAGGGDMYVGRVCHGMHAEAGEQRFNRSFYFLTDFMWIPGIELRWLGVCAKHFYLLSHLTSYSKP